MHDTGFPVVMLIARFHPVGGGTEIQCQRLSLELSRNNFNVTVLTQRVPHTSYAERIDGISVKRIGLPIAGRLGSLSYAVHGFFWLMLHRRSFAVLHAHLASAPAVLGGFISLITGAPLIVKIGGSRSTGDITLARGSLLGRIKWRFLKKTAAGFICPSSEIRDELAGEDVPAEKVIQIPNGIDPGHFCPLPSDGQSRKADLKRTLQIPDHSPVAVFVGRMEEGKGVDVLLNAWNLLTTQLAGSAAPLLLMIGDGSLSERFKHTANDTATVRWCSWVDDIRPYLQSADIFALPSLGEGLPNALLEAMSCGLACIASRIGGASELIEDGVNGILVDPGDEKALAEALATLMKDRDKCRDIGQSARALITEKYSIARVSDQYRTLYRRLNQP